MAINYSTLIFPNQICVVITMCGGGCNGSYSVWLSVIATWPLLVIVLTSVGIAAILIWALVNNLFLSYLFNVVI